MQNTLKSSVRELAERILPEVIAYRRHFHRYPELSFKEENTSRYVAQRLDEMGVSYTSGVAGHGIVALIYGQNPERGVVALRADMDALPITEAGEVEYKSAHPGVMHACGHDAHTAALLGACHILHTLRDQWEGTVKCLFQPAEEELPGGASLMIAEGALENPKPTGIFGQHVYPPLLAGKVGFRVGMYMASTDELYMTVTGRGGHGAMPHECVDPIAMAAQIIVGLQQIVSRQADPTLPTVLTFGKINSVGGATNVITNEVRLEGTFRTMNETWRVAAHQKMKQLAEGIAAAMGGSCEFVIKKGYPVLYNNEKLTRRARQWAVELLGQDRVVDLPLRMTAEDFAYYSQVMPACFYRLGTGNPERGITAPVHTDTFDIDETSLETGMALMAWLAIQELSA